MTGEQSSDREAILELMEKLDEMTGDDGGDRVTAQDVDEYKHGRIESYIELDGTRLTFSPRDDDFVRHFFVPKKKTSYNLNVGPYSVDITKGSHPYTSSGISVVHRENLPGAYEQTAHLGNYFDDWEDDEDEDEDEDDDEECESCGKEYVATTFEGEELCGECANSRIAESLADEAGETDD